MIGSASKTKGYGITVHKEKSQHQLKENIKIGHKNQRPKQKPGISKHAYAQGKEGVDQRSTGKLKEPNPSAPLPSSGRSMSVGIHAKKKAIYPPCKTRKTRAVLCPRNKPKRVKKEMFAKSMPRFPVSKRRFVEARSLARPM